MLSSNNYLNRWRLFFRFIQLHNRDLEGRTEVGKSHTVQSGHADNWLESRTTNTELGSTGIISRYAKLDFPTYDET